jgi:hypothetical protein
MIWRTCLMYLSIAPSILLSMIRASTRIEFALTATTSISNKQHVTSYGVISTCNVSTDKCRQQTHAHKHSSWEFICSEYSVCITALAKMHRCCFIQTSCVLLGPVHLAAELVQRPLKSQSTEYVHYKYISAL